MALTAEQLQLIRQLIPAVAQAAASMSEIVQVIENAIPEGQERAKLDEVVARVREGVTKLREVQLPDAEPEGAA